MAPQRRAGGRRLDRAHVGCRGQVGEVITGGRRGAEGILDRRQRIAALHERTIAILHDAHGRQARRAREVSELVEGKCDMTPDIAMRLGLFFDVPARRWLEMQARFDAHDPERLLQLRSIVTPFDGLAQVLVTPTGARKLDVQEAGSVPPSAPVSADFLARLRAQVEHANRRPDRELRVVWFEDGTPSLTGR